MSRSKTRNIAVAFWLGLFLMSFEPVFIWLLIISVIVLNPEGDAPKKSKNRKDLIYQIGADASKYGVKMPRKPVLRSLLIQVYRKFNQSVAAYPQLRSEYREILDEMWVSLAAEIDAEHWESTISKVCSGWPVAQKGIASSIEERLQKASELTQQWDEAKREVRGGAGV